MNKLNLVDVPMEYNRQTIFRLLQQVEQLTNALAEMRLGANYNARTSAPTTGEFQVGDIVRNATPTEQGSGGSMYIVWGWMCSASSPLAFKELRCLTGN